ncbi:MAG: ExbD/TolR family protein [Phycisphaerales bacterium]
MSRRRSKAFRRRDALHGWTMHFGPNMTPMVDVVMVILVFFMASAAFVGDDWFLRAGVVEPTRVNAAAAAPAKPQAPPDPLAQRIEVLLDRSPTGETLVTAFELVKAPIEAFVARTRTLPRGPASSRLELIVRPASAVVYQDVVRVHEACYAAGIEKVGLGLR